MTTQHTPTEPRITVEKSTVDGVWVVFIATDPHEVDSPRLRVNLNDAAIYENPEFPCGGVER